MEQNEIIALVVSLVGGILLIIILAFLWKKYIKEGPVFESGKTLAGKTVIITGGNAGIGKATAIECAKRKAHLIIASRNVEKSLAARDEIVKETGHDDIHVMKLDLGDLDSVTEFANEILAKEKYIDYLVNNAGIFSLDSLTKQNFEPVFGVNHLGHFLLTNLLLGRMREQASTRPVRIVNLSSAAYKMGSTDFDTAHLEQDVDSGFKLFKLYATSKLANVYFTQSLASRLVGFNITTYSVHPGAVISEIGRSIKGCFYKCMQKMSYPCLRNAYHGCQTTMTCMLDDDILQHNGGYFEGCRVSKLDPVATDNKIGEKLWQHSESLLQPWLSKA